MNELTKRARDIIELLRLHTQEMTEPLIQLVNKQFGHNPFLILISCLLSLRAKDMATYPVCGALFSRARTPEQLLCIPISELEKIVYSIGFYRKKARLLHEVCRFLMKHFEGKVPKTKEELLSIPGVGLKTANLVLGQGFGIPAICVDVHVHRLANKLGLVITKTPEQTERALQEVIPKKDWIEFNKLLVTWGQNMRVPLSPQYFHHPAYQYLQHSIVLKKTIKN